MAKEDLNEKQLRFCNEYVKDLNGTRAYMRAYPDATEKTARSNANKLLTNTDISEEISRLQAKLQKKTEISQEKVLQELSNIAFADIGLVCDMDAEGRLELKTFEEMGVHKKALHSVQQDEIFDKDGNLLRIKNKFNMHDKIKALELLCKHLGMLDGNNDNGRANKEAAERRFLDAFERLEAKQSKRRERS